MTASPFFARPVYLIAFPRIPFKKAKANVTRKVLLSLKKKIENFFKIYSQYFPILQSTYRTYDYITKKEKKRLGKQLLSLITVFKITLEEKLRFWICEFFFTTQNFKRISKEQTCVCLYASSTSCFLFLVHSYTTVFRRTRFVLELRYKTSENRVDKLDKKNYNKQSVAYVDRRA